MKTRTTLMTASALVMAAGAAVADVSLSGDGRMGVVSNENDDLMFSSRVRIKFSASAELDNGLSAAASFRAADAVDAGSGTAGEVSLSGPFGTLAMGSVDSAANAAVGQVAGVGYTGVGSLEEISYLGSGDKPALLYTLPKLGLVQAYASIGMHDDPQDDAGTEISGDTVGIGAKADLTIGEGTAWLAGGYESSTTDEMDGQLAFGAGIDALGLSAKLVGSMQGGNNGAEDVDRLGISVGYSSGLMGATIFYNDNADMSEAVGAGVSYSLGGDAALKAGISTNNFDEEGRESERRADLGITFSF